jgi:hypothetical protein
VIVAEAASCTVDTSSSRIWDTLGTIEEWWDINYNLQIHSAKANPRDVPFSLVWFEIKLSCAASRVPPKYNCGILGHFCGLNILGYAKKGLSSANSTTYWSAELNRDDTRAGHERGPA